MRTMIGITSSDKTWKVPFFWIPLADVEAGPGDIRRHPKDDRDASSEDYWLGVLGAQGKEVDILGFESGPLKGHVTFLFDRLGK